LERKTAVPKSSMKNGQVVEDRYEESGERTNVPREKRGSVSSLEGGESGKTRARGAFDRNRLRGKKPFSLEEKEGKTAREKEGGERHNANWGTGNSF